MRHQKSGRHFNRDTDARKALMRNLCTSLLESGRITTTEARAKEWEDVRFGFRVAKDIGRWDIGQSVVVKRGAVLAVEGIEGTDATIRRAGELANGDVVLVKVCKPTQDTRFDLPAVGPATVTALAQVHGRALAIEAGSTVILDRDEMVALADRADIAVVAVDGKEGDGG